MTVLLRCHVCLKRFRMLGIFKIFSQSRHKLVNPLKAWLTCEKEPAVKTFTASFVMV